MPPWPEDGTVSYAHAVRRAHELLLNQRRWRSENRAVLTFPLVVECESTSYLPAEGPYRWAGSQAIVSRASRLKSDEARQYAQARKNVSSWKTPWVKWVTFLGQQFVDYAERMLPDDFTAIGKKCRGRTNYIGLIYADGNALGKLVQELDDVVVSREFASLVDGAIHEACFLGLKKICRKEIEAAQQAVGGSGEPADILPVDILLLGGDDLVVVTPADRALDFALEVCTYFQRITRDRMAHLSERSKHFYKEHGLLSHGLTISCGVAIGPSRTPFFVLLNLADELQQIAKTAGSSADRDAEVYPQSPAPKYCVPAYIDFHVLSGSITSDISTLCREAYFSSGVGNDYGRTLRPYSVSMFGKLKEAVERLREVNIPRSKLHELFECLLDSRPLRAQFAAQHLFGRLRHTKRHPQRQALWSALSGILPIELFPWSRYRGRFVTSLVDVIEAYDFFYDDREVKPEEDNGALLF